MYALRESINSSLDCKPQPKKIEKKCDQSKFTIVTSTFLYCKYAMCLLKNATKPTPANWNGFLIAKQIEFLMLIWGSHIGQIIGNSFLTLFTFFPNFYLFIFLYFIATFIWFPLIIDLAKVLSSISKSNSQDSEKSHSVAEAINELLLM